MKSPYLAWFAWTAVVLLAGCTGNSTPSTSAPSSSATPGSSVPIVSWFNGTLQAGTGLETTVASGCAGHSVGVALFGSQFGVDIPERYGNATLAVNVTTPAPGASFRLCLFGPGGTTTTVTGPSPLVVHALVRQGHATVAFLPDNTRPGAEVDATFAMSLTMRS